ncbi:MAG: L-threonylcarbamoyladenylate synthase [Coleofasciculaceae cyanobacterium SM2_1_6]|nr:L-threonylcarbamoyladenylate synthase [Coleofasciculaceae cyanobacterium SM2_1_6]
MMQVDLSQLIMGAKAGQLVSFPTDTVPALASLPDRAELIFVAKGRSLDKPLILMGAELEDLLPFVQGTAAELAVWRSVAAQYFPGALTLVLPASDRLPPQMNPLNPTSVGIRVPNHPLARKILAATSPLATTSVNRSGKPALTDPVAIHAQFPEILILPPSELADVPQGAGKPSTVAQWVDSGWQILRQGEVQFG